MVNFDVWEIMVLPLLPVGPEGTTSNNEAMLVHGQYYSQCL